GNVLLPVDVQQLARCVIFSRPSCCTSTGSSTLPSTVRQGNSTGDWNTTPMSLRGPAIGVPLSNACPPLACISPARIFSSVDLPHPDGPTIDMNSPSATVQSMSSSAVTPPPRPP